MASVRVSVWCCVLFVSVQSIMTQDLDYDRKGWSPLHSTQSAHPAPEFRKHSIIRPRFYHGREKREISSTRSKDKGMHVHDLTIGYNVDGVQYILDLQLNRGLIPNTYFQKHQEDGVYKLHSPSPEELDLCHYKGELRGVPNSWVAVSTCDGLRGVVFDGTELQYLEKSNAHGPATENIRDNNHVFVYKHSDIRETNLTCGYEGTPRSTLQNGKQNNVVRRKRASETTDDGIEEQVLGPYNSNKKSRYVELVLVVDNKEYKELGESLPKVYRHCKDIANIINALYAPLNIFIALVGVVVWSDYDEIALVTNGDTTLTNFLHYRRGRLAKEHPNDNAQLLTRIQFDNGVVGKALKGPMCTYEFSGGVNMDHSNVVGLVATTVAHEMGHNFGMEHDSNDCNCPSERCIMAPSSSSLSPTQWSSCSENYLLLAFHHGMDYCLHNKPTKLFDSPVCGNGFVEPGEQCDCGLEDRCSNPCCNASTCMLHPNASCATGECCDFETCRPKAAGSECRTADQECDLPEFCTGRSEFCPMDVFKLDGESCNHGKAFCYQGACRTRSDQCRLLWGPSGKSSDTQCYKMNTKGTRHGNCGYNRLNQSYVKCTEQDVFCGMLHCKHLNERLEFGMESVSILSHSFINSGGSIIPCRTAIVDLGLNEVDPGLAPDGSKCGEGKMCVNQKCMEISSLRASSSMSGCPQNCNGNGVCNSKGHCHCNPGFAPPFCDYPGTGGSEDSGPASDPDAGRRVMTALYIIFLGIVPFVGVVALIIYYTRPRVKHWWKKPSGVAAHGGPRHSTTTSAQNRACRGNNLAFRSLDRSGGGPKSSGTSGPREVSSPLRSPQSSDGTQTSLLLHADTPGQSPSTSNGSSPVSSLQISLIGQFKGFSIVPINTNSSSPSTLGNVTLRNDPVPLTVVPSRPASAKPWLINNPRSTTSVTNEVPAASASSALPALPPAKVQSTTARPLISSPILDATTSSTARELVGSHTSVAPVRPIHTRPAPGIPTGERKSQSYSAQPSTSVTAVEASDESNSGLDHQTSNYPTLIRLASMLRPSNSFRARVALWDEPQSVKASKLLDKEKLRSLQISSPILQQEIQVPHMLPVQPAQPVVMRAKSMRTAAPSKRPAIHSFGSMRQPGKRPTSIPPSNPPHRPKSPPPPRPPVPPDIQNDSLGIVGLPGYQNPPDLKSNKLSLDYSYDDCLNLMGGAPLAHIDEEHSPINSDNIYAVIEELPPHGGRSRIGFITATSQSCVKKPEYISPTASVYHAPRVGDTIPSAGSCESVGLLGEIVSEIQARNTDSIYSTSTVNKRGRNDDNTEDVMEYQTALAEQSDLSGTYMNMARNFENLSSSNGYLRPNAVNVGTTAVGSSVSALEIPSTAAPATTCITSDSSFATTSSTAYKPYGASLQSHGSSSFVASKPNIGSSVAASVQTEGSEIGTHKQSDSRVISSALFSVSTPASTTGSTTPANSGTGYPRIMTKPALSTSPDVVSSCSAAVDSSSPDVISPAGNNKIAYVGVARAQSDAVSSSPPTITATNPTSSNTTPASSSTTPTSSTATSNFTLRPGAHSSIHSSVTKAPNPVILSSSKPAVSVKASPLLSTCVGTHSVRPPIDSTKPFMKTSTISAPNQTLTLQKRAEASKMSHVASLQQRFEASSSNKQSAAVKPRVPSLSSKPSIASNK